MRAFPTLCMHKSSQAEYKSFWKERERTFSGPFTVTAVFKGCTRVCLVFSAVSPRPSLPSPAIGGGGSGERWCKGQAAGRWPGSYLISARVHGAVRNDHNWIHTHQLGVFLALQKLEQIRALMRLKQEIWFESKVIDLLWESELFAVFLLICQ